jgi:CubicO group peptidase (beta-lactamase class C family)
MNPLLFYWTRNRLRSQSAAEQQKAIKVLSGSRRDPRIVEPLLTALKEDQDAASRDEKIPRSTPSAFWSIAEVTFPMPNRHNRYDRYSRRYGGSFFPFLLPLFLSAFLVAASPLGAQTLNPATPPATVPGKASVPIVRLERTEELEKVVREEMERTKTPGVVVAIVKGGKLVYSRGFGVANVETSQPMTPDMLFPIASMTKMYTAATLLALMEEKALKPESKIGPSFDMATPGLAALTFHQLLTHTAGLPSDGTHRSFFDNPDHRALSTQIETLTDRVFFTQPGAIFSYSNTGYLLCGYLIEKLSAESYASAVQKRLLTPLGMTRSTFDPGVAITYPISQSHVGASGQTAQVQRPMRFALASSPGGGLYSNAEELSHFAIAFMNEGKWEGRSVIPTAIVRQMATGHAPVRSQVEGGSYGYGLMARQYRGIHLVEHGSTSDFVMAPDQHTAVIVLTNRGDHLTQTTEKALEIALSLPPRAEETPPALPFPETERNEYLGKYAQDTNGTGLTLQIERRGGDDGVSLKMGTRIFPLTRIAPDVFTIAFPGFSSPLRVEFVRGKDKQIRYLHIRLRAFQRVP